MVLLSRFTLPAVAATIALVALVAGGRQVTFSAPVHQAAGPTTARNYVVTSGYGTDDWAANIYSPSTLNIYAGDSVTWVSHSRLEPHTITFGPYPLLRKLFTNTVIVKPQPAGPPQLSLNPQIGFPTTRKAYDGTGYANSGFLTAGKKWTITFTKPGNYTYYCLVHFPGMFGVVRVHARPAAAATNFVRTGYGTDRSAADAFFPETLTIHAGQTVEWYGASFHTVTFAPAAMINALRRQLLIPTPQKSGPPLLVLNPRIAFPTGGATYNGQGVVSSGLLQPPHNTYRLTFTTPGVYHYGCLVHPGMDGTIRVLP